MHFGQSQKSKMKTVTDANTERTAGSKANLTNCSSFQCSSLGPNMQTEEIFDLIQFLYSHNGTPR